MRIYDIQRHVKIEPAEALASIQGQQLTEHSGRKFFVCRPTGSQFWAYLSRQLAFEDPEDKYRRLCALASRQIKEGDLKRSVDIESFEPGLADHLFQSVYGASEPSWSDRALSVFLAYEDLKRFTVSGFDSWRLRAGRGAGAVGANSWIESGILSLSQALWIERAAAVVPEWDRLKPDGPWLDDPRCRFLLDCLSRFQTEFANVKPDIGAAGQIFSDELRQSRPNLPGEFLPDLVLFVEGPTEEIVLPAAAKLLSFDLDRNAVYVLVAGGAKPLAKRFLELGEVMSLPSVAVLDGDAREEAAVVTDMAKTDDRVFVFSQGEIEDTFNLGFFVKVLNKYLETNRAVEPVASADFNNASRRTACVNRLWRKRGLGDFDKIGLARLVAREMSSPEDVPPAVAKIVEEMRALISGETGGR